MTAHLDFIPSTIKVLGHNERNLPTMLRQFVAPLEMGYKFINTKDKPRVFLKTGTINARIAAANRADFLTNYELNLHYRHHDHFRLYYVNRGDSHYIYPYIDVDNQPHLPDGDSRQAVERLLAHYKIEAYHAPTTNGWSFYPCVDVRHYQPDEINAGLNQFAANCNQLAGSWGLRVKVEAKALPAIKHPLTGQIITRGTLGRLPMRWQHNGYSPSWPSLTCRLIAKNIQSVSAGRRSKSLFFRKSVRPVLRWLRSRLKFACRCGC